MAEAGRVITGSAGGIRLAGARARARGRSGDRVKQALFAIAGVGARRRLAGARPGPVRGQRRGGHRGAQPGRAAGGVRGARRGAPRARHRGEPAPTRGSSGGARRAARRRCGSWRAGAAPAGAARGPFGLVRGRPALRRDRRSSAAALARLGDPTLGWLRDDARRGRQALLARRRRRPAAGACGAPRERRFGETALTLLSARAREVPAPSSERRQRREDRGLSGLVRPHHPRPPGRHRARRRRLRAAGRGGAGQPAQVARARRGGARRDHPRGARRAARRRRRPRRGDAPSTGSPWTWRDAVGRRLHRARAARHQRLRDRSSRWPTSTASWRPTSTPSSS